MRALRRVLPLLQMRRCVALTTLFPTLVTLESSGLAASLNVTNTNDSGPGSLRQAVADSNVAGSSNTITFAGGVTGVITLTTEELLISNNVSIIGPGDKALTIQGNNTARVVSIAQATVSISGLGIANGSNALGGGVLLRSGMLSLTRCTVTKNSAVNGGGIAQTNGTLLIVESTISSNKASTAGAGIYLLSGTIASLRGCTLAGNSGSGLLTVGGGVAHDSVPLVLDSCTFCDNGGGGTGGGVNNNSGSLSVTNCTFSANHAFQGGGIAALSGIVTIRNTILAANTSSASAALAAPDCLGTIVSAGFNLVGNPTNSSGWGASGDQLGTAASPLNPLLAPLQDNGGPTWTMSLSNNSPAIDKGESSGATTDQRGALRPLDKPQVANAADGDGSDIGAYEAGTRTLTVSNLNDLGPGSLRQAIFDAAVEDVTTIVFAPGLAGTIYPSTGLSLNKNLVINGPGASLLALSGISLYRVLWVYDTATISGITIKDGAVQGEDGGAEGNGESVNGGGILNLTNLTLIDCVISNNVAKGGAGGSTSTGIAGNGGNALGAGIANLGTLTMNRCILARNSTMGGAAGMATGGGANGQGGSGFGGGIYSTGSATLFGCTLYGNQASGGIQTMGGPPSAGSAFYGKDSSLTYMYASTVTSNGGSGGAFYDLGANGVIRNSTIAGNQSGGAYLSGASVGSSIIATNSQSWNLQGNLISADFNLFDDTNGVQISGSIAQSVLGQNPLLGPLQYNGGPTPTMALLPGSPAIDKGASFGTLTDQRGRPRSYEFSNIPNALDATDIGAYELIPLSLNIARQATNAWLSWTTNEPSFLLEGTTNLALPLNWVQVPGTPSVSGTQFVVVDALGPRKFYRLRSP